MLLKSYDDHNRVPFVRRIELELSPEDYMDFLDEADGMERYVVDTLAKGGRISDSLMALSEMATVIERRQARERERVDGVGCEGTPDGEG